MKHSTKVTVYAGLGLLAIGGIAYATQSYSEHSEMRKAFAPERMMERVDTDGDKAASREELFAMIDTRFSSADTDNNGKVTKAEIIAAIEASDVPDKMKRRSGKIADRIVGRADINQDGTVELAEIKNRAGKFHALADWNDDGRVEIAEAQRMRPGHRGGWRKDRN